MDANRFDDLVKRVGVTRLTRWGALRGLAAGGLAALTGVSLSADETDAAKNDKKKRICHCAGSTVDTCRNKKLSKAKAKKHLKKHKCDYKGKCRGFNPCSPAPTSGSCSSNAQCGNQACVGGKCGPCSSNAQCGSGQACISGVCGPCTNASQCATGQGCNSGVCGPCTLTDQCASGLICVVGGVCVAPGATCTASPDTCPDPLVCLGTICVLPGTGCTGGVGGICPTGQTCLVGICVEECNLTSVPPDPCSGALVVCVLGICIAVV